MIDEASLIAAIREAVKKVGRKNVITLLQAELERLQRTQAQRRGRPQKTVRDYLVEGLERPDLTPGELAKIKQSDPQQQDAAKKRIQRARQAVAEYPDAIDNWLNEALALEADRRGVTVRTLLREAVAKVRDQDRDK